MNLLMSPLIALTKGLEHTIDYIRQGEERPYLEGNYGPVNEEVREDDCQLVEGEIPGDLVGVFLRNGPNPKLLPRGLYHWFDGDGMVHSIRFQDGKACYSNHQTRTLKVKQDLENGEPQLATLGDLRGPLGLVKMGLNGLRLAIDRNLVNTIKTSEGTANTALVFHNNMLMALVESSLPMMLRVDANDGKVDSVGPNDYGGKLKHPFTAHPKVCPYTGELLFFGYQIDTQPYVSYSVASASGELLSTIDVGLSRPIMMHDFTITKSFSCFLDLPLIFKPQNLLLSKSVFEFDKNDYSRIGIVPRHAKSGEEVVWFSVKTCSVFHVANSYEIEENGETVVVINACRFEEVDLEHLTSTPSLPYEWRLHMGTGLVTERPLAQVSGDFPVVNPNYHAKKHKYVYVAILSAERETASFPGIAKIDVDQGCEVGRLEYGDSTYGGEMSFVPKEGARSEDDGYLVGFTHNEKANSSECWILSAETMQCLCRVNISTRVPYGFHSLWLPKAKVQQQQIQSKL